MNFYQGIMCSECGDTIATIDEIFSNRYTYIYPDYFCENCISDMKHELTEDLKDLECDECGKKLINGDDGLEEAEQYYKINNHFYCVDCINSATDRTENIDKSEFVFERD